MCCFGGPVRLIKHVSKTNIFARADGQRQFLAYSMNIVATAPVAMILPLPVPPRSPEDAVQFVSLEKYDRFFVDLDAAFPKIMIAAPASRGGGGGGGSFALPTLEVHRVGRFEASFVPTLADFARLDARFRIADDVWRALPQYADWGFAVFKLVDLGGWLRRKRTIHPMAFSFPRRDDTGLFFPTVHVHDAEVHDQAGFDHMLYYQSDVAFARDTPLMHQTSPAPAAQSVDVARAAGLVDGAQPLRRASVYGTRKNEDTWLRPR